MTASKRVVAFRSGLLFPLHSNWRSHQQTAVRLTLASSDMTVWIAVSGGTIGFGVTRIVDPQRQIGEIYMLAVDPMPRKALAMTKTGADPGQPRPGEATRRCRSAGPVLRT